MMKSIKSNSLRIKLMMLSIIFITIPTFLVGLISYKKAYDMMLETTIENAMQLSNQLADNVELSFYDIERFATISKNTNIIRFLMSKDMEERTQYSFALIDLFNLYKDTYRFSDSIKDIKIIGVNNRNFSQRKGNFDLDEEIRNQYIEVFRKSEGTMAITFMEDTGFQAGDDSFTILVGKPIFQVATNDLLGVVVLEFSAEPFTNFTKEATIGTEGHFVIADNRQIIFDDKGIRKDSDFSKEELETIYTDTQGSFIRNVNGRKELVIYSQVNDYRWMVIGTVFLDDIMSEAYTIKVFSVSVSLICMLVAVLLNVYIMRWLFIPLDNLRKKMMVVAEGDLDVKLSHRTNDEIATLNASFNKMISQIKYLVKKNAEEQEKLQKSKLQVLQAQINPHFLYNTLDTIIWLINGKENNLAIEMVDALSRFFRTSLSKGKDAILVSDELSHIESYLTIQKCRNRDILDYVIDVNTDILGYKMMKLMIQPLVENAIYHGLKPKNGGGKIWVKGWAEKDRLVFTVRDDGVGMSESQLSDLRIGLAGEIHIETESDDLSGFGLMNVQQRINLYYPEDCGIRIDSQEGQGTNVTLRIGKEME